MEKYKPSEESLKFIAKAKDKYGDKYNYDKVEYLHSKSKVIITCPECGVEKTTSAKQADPCKNGWSYSKWKIRGENNKDFDGFKLYIIECTDGDETFLKIGKTFTTLTKRYYGNRLSYNWRVVTSIVGTAEYISDLEEELHRNLKNAGYKYTPKKKFNGSSECYKCKYIEEINI